MVRGRLFTENQFHKVAESFLPNIPVVSSGILAEREIIARALKISAVTFYPRVQNVRTAGLYVIYKRRVLELDLKKTAQIRVEP